MALKLIDDDGLRLRRIQANGLFALGALLLAAAYVWSEPVGKAWDRAWEEVDFSRLPRVESPAAFVGPAHTGYRMTGDTVVLVMGWAAAGVCAIWGFYLRDPGSFPRETANM